MKRNSTIEVLAIPALVASLTFGTGCGAIGEMIKDPTSIQSTAKLSQEQAPLPVVVRRADVASTTATEVDRLLTATPVDATADWLKQIQLSPDDIAAAQKQLADHPYYDKEKWAIAPAEVWAPALSAVKSHAGQSPSLLAAISPDLGNGYAQVQAKIEAEAALRTRLKAEEDARDAKGATDADKKAHQAAADALGTQIDAAKKDIDAAKTAFEASCKASAAAVPPATRDEYLVTIVNLRRAVHDAKVANIAAAARYPLLVVQVVQNPVSFKDALVSAAKGQVSDVLYEQVGKRVKLRGTVELTYQNGNVDVILGGFAVGDLGKLTPHQLVKETVARTSKFALEAVTLPVVLATTQEKLDFESDVLDGIKDGFRASGGAVPAPAEISVKTSIEIQASATTGPQGPVSFNRPLK